MSAVAAQAWRVRERVAAVPDRLAVPLGLGLLLAVSLLLRTQAIRARFWIDEGISVGIASHPLLDIPEVLRLDGAPPLYYLLLHAWMRVAGSGEGDTHALSLGFALLCIPVAFLLCDRLFGRREAWIGALVAALVPYLTYYAQETRMYSMVALLSLVACATFALAFVQRRRGWLPLFALSVAALVLSHNWGLFLAVALAGGVLALRRTPGVLRDGVLAFAAVGVAYLPWLPILLHQAAHTGAPWAERPTPGQAVSGLTQLLGGEGPAVASLLGAGAGLAALLARPRVGQRSVAARGALAIGGVALGTLLLAYGTSLASPAWANRYFAVLVGPVILLAAAGFARGGRVGLLALAVVALFWGTNTRAGELTRKSNAHPVAATVRDRLEPGDTVVVTHPEQGPLMHYYLPDGLRWWDSLGPVTDPRVFDWTDALERLRATDTETIAGYLVLNLAPGEKLLLVQPVIRASKWDAPWTRLVRRRAGQWSTLLDRDRRLARVLTYPRFRGRPLARGVRAVLYERR